MKPTIQFDEGSHTYLVNGESYPSVTQILKDLSAREYRFVDAAVMAEAAWLGQAVHRLIELDIAGTLDEDALDDRLLGYLEKWREFLAQSDFEPILSEERVCSVRYRYAGTLDLFGVLHGRLALIDAKRTSSVPRTAGPQTAGYEVALRELRPDLFKTIQPIDRYALQLTPGTRPGWQLVPLRSANDQRVFMSALTINTWSNAA